MTLAALKLNGVEQALTGSTQLRRVLFDCYWLVSWATVSPAAHSSGSYVIVVVLLVCSMMRVQLEAHVP